MTNVNLSYAREVLRYKFTGEDDFQERNIRISIFRRPVGKGEKGLGQNPQLPNVSFCMHWGVWVEFDGTKEGLGRCIYTFDADIHKKDNVDLCKSTDWSTHMKALFAGDFTVTGFEFFPDLKVQKNSKYATKHPYEDEIIHNEDYVVGRLSPARLLQIVRSIAIQYDDKTYNFLFHNCQDFAIDLSSKIAQSMKNSSSSTSSRSSNSSRSNGQSSQPEQAFKSQWTSGDTILATAVTVGITGLGVWGLSKLFSKNGGEEESDEHQRNRQGARQRSAN